MQYKNNLQTWNDKQQRAIKIDINILIIINSHKLIITVDLKSTNNGRLQKCRMVLWGQYPLRKFDLDWIPQIHFPIG